MLGALGWSSFIKSVLKSEMSSFQDLTSFSFDFFTYVLGLIFFLTNNYVLCYFITSSTLNIMSIDAIIYDLLWYRLPCKDQFAIQMIMLRTQVPHEIKGLGVFVCSLTTYFKVNTIDDMT